MDAEVKNEEVTDNEKIPILIEPKQEIEDSVELIEPKIELIDEMDLKKEEIDEDQYQHIIPHEYRDYLEQHTEEKQPTNSRKRPADDSSTSKKDTIECLICRKNLSISCWSNLKTHALSHAGLKLFECPAIQCNYGSYSKWNVSYHIKSKHKSCSDPVRKNEMTDEYRQVVMDTINKCFPKTKICEDSKDTMSEKASIKCLKCGKRITLSSVTCPKVHALRHTDLKIYKCPAIQCDYKSYEYSTVSHHMKRKHESCTDPVIKNEMSDEEKQILKDMIHECFPDLEDYMEMKVRLRNVNCQLCHRDVKNCKQARQEHSIEHINPFLFKCDEQDCEFSTNFFDSLSSHVYCKHQKVYDTNDRKLQLKKQAMEFKKWNDICFSNKEEDSVETVEYPAPVAKKLVEKEQYDYTCQICQKQITEVRFWSQNARRNHASEHVDNIYKCSSPDCQFHTKYQNELTEHLVTFHSPLVANSNVLLATAQTAEIERMFIRCFPETVKKEINN